MNFFKKQYIMAIVILCTGFFSVFSAGAQTWTAVYAGINNPCMYPSEGVNTGSPGQCQCNSGYTWGTASGANCTMDGFLPGCWNPNNGTCNTCGQGGTVVLGSHSCFTGQNNQGGTNPSKVGITCNGGGTLVGATSSASCISSGSSGGQAQ